MELTQLLSLKMEIPFYGKGSTLGDFFYNLISTLWQQGEAFSGKRPFGFAGWQSDVYAVLIRNKVIPGSLDEDGYVTEIDRISADQFILSSILLPLFSQGNL